MTKRTTAPTGAPCWIDLGTSDPDRSRAFYCDLFGWTVDDPGPDYGGYVNFQKDGIPVGGCMQNPGTGPDGWTVYLETPDAEKVVANSPNVIAPAMAVMALGTMAIVADPGGAIIGAWQPGDHKGFGIHDEPNTPGWFELHTRDYDTAVEFYRSVFAWPVHTAADEPGFRYTTYGEGDGQLAGIMDASAFLPEGVPAHWSVYFRVANADATIAKAISLGATVVQPAEDTPYGRLATLADATGASFKLIG